MIRKNYDLQNNNSFGVSQIAENFYTFSTENELLEVMKELSSETFFILGAGNNVLFTKNIKNVIHSKIDFITKIKEQNGSIYIESGSGTNWDEFVSYCCKNDFYGTENLTAIPSSVGATAAQNIGAYGVEVKDIIDSVKVLDTFYNNFLVLNNIDCKFGYRDSIFKHTDRYIIISVTFKLSTIKKINIEYKDIQTKLSESNLAINQLTSQQLSRIIKEIRDTKLPNVDTIGNAGSFFKNPTISADSFTSIKKNHPEINGYKTDAGIKISAAFLIEKTGLKGYRVKDAAVYDKHSLILVNHGEASGKEIVTIAKHVISEVESKFNITLEPEVEIL